MSKPEPDPSRDQAYHILSNARRRFVLQYLEETEEPIKLIDLAKQGASWENEKPIDELTEKEKKRMYVSLYQTHIPKLSDAGLIHYDTDSQEIRLAAGPDTELPPIDSDKSEPRWYQYYFFLAVFNIALLSIGVVIPPSFAVSSKSYIIVVLGSFGTLALIHTIYSISN